MKGIDMDLITIYPTKINALILSGNSIKNHYFSDS